MISRQEISSIANYSKYPKCETLNFHDPLQCQCGYVLRRNLFQKSISSEQSELVPIKESKIFLGMLAATTGGCLWALITVVIGYDVGILAWALGLLRGFAVVRFTSRQKRPSLQIIAVVSSVLNESIHRKGFRPGGSRQYVTFFRSGRYAVLK